MYINKPNSDRIISLFVAAWWRFGGVGLPVQLLVKTVSWGPPSREEGGAVGGVGLATHLWNPVYGARAGEDQITGNKATILSNEMKPGMVACNPVTQETKAGGFVSLRTVCTM